MIDYEKKNNEWLRYGPLSPDAFNKVWMFGDICDGALMLQNQVYLSRIKAKDYLSIKAEKASALAKTHKSYEFFFMTAFSDIDEQPYWWWQKTFRSYARPLVQSRKTSTEVLLKIIATDTSPNWAWNIASHINMPIEKSASWVLERLLFSGMSIDKLASKIAPKVEAKCDAYLSKLGWDKETLDVTSLDMKIKVIAS